MFSLLADSCGMSVRGSESDAVQVSDAFDLSGANSLEYELVVISIELDEEKFLRVEVEESNDRENWSAVADSSITALSMSSTYKEVTGISSAWARLKYTLDSPLGAQDNNRAVFASNVWTSDQNIVA